MELIQEFITASQAAKLAGYNPDYFSSLIRGGEVRGRKVGKNWVTTRQEVDRFLKKRATAQSNHPIFYTTKVSSRFGLTPRFVFIAFIAAVFLSVASYGIYAAIYNVTWGQLAAVASATNTSSQTLP